MTSTPTPSVEEMCAEALALDEKATEGPWAYESVGQKCNDIFIGTMQHVDSKGSLGPLLSGCPETADEEGEEFEFYREPVAHIDDAETQGRPVQDAALIARYRTLCPDLARLLLSTSARLKVAEEALIDQMVGNIDGHRYVCDCDGEGPNERAISHAPDCVLAVLNEPEASPAKPVPKPTQGETDV